MILFFSNLKRVERFHWDNGLLRLIVFHIIFSINFLFLIIKLEEVFDVESGLWTFHKNSPSKINVSSDSTCETLKKNFKARIIPETGSLYQSNSEKCSCGVGNSF